MEEVNLKQIGFDRFDIISLNECIGCNRQFLYDEHDNKVKVFNSFKLELTIAPKKRKEFVIKRPDFDIGEAIQKMNGKINFTPFIKDGNVYYKLVDTNQYIVNNIKVYLDKFYTWKEGKQIITNQIKNNNDECKFYVELNNDFYNSLSFHKIKYDDYITYYD